LQLTNIVEGADDEVEPSYQLAEGQQFVGTFHTHPYVTGWRGAGFSGEDLATALLEQSQDIYGCVFAHEQKNNIRDCKKINFPII